MAADGAIGPAMDAIGLAMAVWNWLAAAATDRAAELL